MAEIQDSEFLRILRETPVVPEDQIRSAQELQRTERDRQGSCRTLFAILVAQGLIDERVAHTIRRSSSDPLPGEVTPHTPTVVLPAPDEMPASEPRTGSSTSISFARAARKRPPEVQAAAGDPRNLLGPYVLLREVGKGGMGRVYHAWDENVGRYVAVKVIDTEDVEDRERFVREAQIAGRLSHPSIATVFQAGEQGTRGFIAMQFIEGGPIGTQKLPLRNLLLLVRDAARALSYAHEQGVIHRDVKPGNLMVDEKGQLFLTDFGLAKEIVAGAGTQLSITGTTFGTPQFMSPEQARGEHRTIDARSDVYSLGATLYALVGGRPAFTATNLAGLLLEVLNKTPAPLSRLNPQISPELEMFVEQAMAKEPAERFPTMAAFAETLDRLIRLERYSGHAGWARALSRRWLPRVAVAGGVAAALWFGLPLLLASRKPPAPDPAAGLYPAAAAALRTLEGQSLKPSDRNDRLEQQVIRPLAGLLERNPGDLHARALRLRAFFVGGDRAAATRELSALRRRGDEDYRVRFVAAAMELENALGTPCPMPAVESPAFEWEQPPAPWPPVLIEEVEGVAHAKVTPELAEDYQADRAVIEGMAALVAGQYGNAAVLLQHASLPVLQAAWCRAAYLDARFAEVVRAEESRGRRERLGAGLALALGSAGALEALLAHAGADAPLVHAALARLDGAEGAEVHAEAAMTAAPPERRAALESVELRRKALCGADGEKEYREAVALAGDAPATWSGRLASIELRIGWGTRLLRSRKNGSLLLEEAARRADDLVRAAPGWTPPRLLSCLARLRLGRLEEARADLSKVLPEARGGVRACLVAAALDLAVAERERRSGGACAEAARACQQEALAAPRDHPEARELLGAATLLLAQQAASEGKDESGFVKDAVEALTQAIDRLPGYVQARYDRARALFLQAEIDRRHGGDGRRAGEKARADTDAALAAVPDFLPARYLRGVVSFSLGRDAEAVADWRSLIQADPSWDSADVRSWIQRAEGRLKK